MIHLARPIAPSNARYLPAVPDGFSLGADERLSAGLRRLSLEEFDRAIRGLTRGADLDQAVHEARKSLKRLRAMLRLIRDELGEDVYRAENEMLRDAGRLIGPVRDAAVLVETVSGMRSRFSAHLRRGTLEGVELRLAERHDRISRAMVDDEEQIHRVVLALRSARARYRVWPVEGDEVVAAYGRTPVEHSFHALRSGLERTYRRGRKEMRRAAAEPTGHNFHQWRKRVKYLKHQMELLQPLWPEMIGGYSAVLDDLSEMLGEEHDLAELLRLAASEPGLCDDPVERALLTALAQHRRAEVQTAAMAIGRRVYAEKPARFTERMSAYWTAWTALDG